MQVRPDLNVPHGDLNMGTGRKILDSIKRKIHPRRLWNAISRIWNSSSEESSKINDNRFNAKLLTRPAGRELSVLASDKQVMETCKQAKAVIQALSDYFNSLLEEFSQQENILNQRYISLHQFNAYASKVLKIHQKCLNILEKEKTSLLSLTSDLEKSERDMQANIVYIQQKINRQKKKKFNASIDWIPGVGIVAGIVTKDYYRMIPFYSTVKGIKSAVCDKEDAYRENLHRILMERIMVEEQLNNASFRLEDVLSTISKYQDQLAINESAINLIDDQIKQNGKDITLIRDINLKVNQLILKYDFLRSRIENVEDLIELESLAIEDIQSFLVDLKEIQILIQDFLLAHEFVPGIMNQEALSMVVRAIPKIYLSFQSLVVKKIKK